MSRASRDKGARGEREVAEIFRRHGFDCDRVPNSGGLRLKGDLEGVSSVHVEVKRGENARIWQWWEQAYSEAPRGRMPVLAFRRNRSSWLAVLELEDLAALLDVAGVYGRQYLRSQKGGPPNGFSVRA